jgi:hypothetical protein
MNILEIQFLYYFNINQVFAEKKDFVDQVLQDYFEAHISFTNSKISHFH